MPFVEVWFPAEAWLTPVLENVDTTNIKRWITMLKENDWAKQVSPPEHRLRNVVHCFYNKIFKTVTLPLEIYDEPLPIPEPKEATDEAAAS
jgi:hypothetical protein